MTQDSSTADETALHALVDGRLTAAEREALHTRLAVDTQAARTAQAWMAQREALRALHREVLQEPVPPALAQVTRQLDQQRGRLGRWQRWGGVAAAVLLAFGLGWASHGQWDARGPASQVARARPVVDFGRQAVVAHVVFSPEIRHPVEVTAAQQEHLVQWLSKRLGRSLKVPDLTMQGYELVGGRLLSGGQGPRAQFMYQNLKGDRLTLYVGALEGTPDAQAARETAFRFTSEAGTSSFYWVDQGFGYALAGRLGRAELLPLADVVYKQL
ncbi:MULTISPECIES: anti-sigma factor family protein [Ramlibacter]|uniref:Anti-sigma factor n=1 Tax=Ramlibacter pinisoli TaxID=2682844 RepID=A0A6N8IUY2_9BURK|nr:MULTISPECIES: anti-sigma factor [Ramlibacter]MBA2960832.1 anti-sigma factor [Ramlibacter sp. CGMCC 1.13660]MVQ30779.1 anti-sigma factor [Ramlibacter pinisoli]